MLRFVVAVAICLSASPRLSAQELTGKPWVDMDYGPFLSMTIEADGPGKNIAYKGVMVTLDEATQTYALFDEDLMRYAAVWTGGKLNWRSVIYDGSHNSHPAMVGNQIFGNAIRPGWSISGDFKDPRQFPYGPLPRGQAHYKGLYLHDGRVVFQYTVGGAMVREMPGLEKVGDQLVVTRTIEIDRTRTAVTLQVAESPDAPTQVLRANGMDFAVLGDLSAPESEPAAPVVPQNGLVGRWTFDAEKGLKLRGGATIGNGHEGRGLNLRGRQPVEPELEAAPRFGGRDYSIAAWVRTKRGGTIAALAPKGKWVEGGKSLFIRGGVLTFDIGWVGAVRGKTSIADGQWHHVAVTHRKNGEVELFVDGALDGSGRLESRDDPRASRIAFGVTSNNFPSGPANKLVGDLDDICIFNRALKANEVHAMAPAGQPPGITASAVVGAPANASWRIDDDSALRLHIPPDSTPAKFKVLVWSGRQQDFGRFQAAARDSAGPVSLEPLTKGGSSRFEEVLTTRGKLGTSKEAYVIDELTPPTENPWRSWLRFGGFDFFEDSTKAAICTWNGDVWIVSGIDGTLSELKWKRIATGMFQPLGVRIVNDDIYICCRDQITILRDQNGDGETDYYENFNNDHQVTEHFHEFAMDLQTDAKGNFYYAKSARHALDSVVPHHGTLIRVSPDGRTSEIVCNGFRAANGVGIGPNGELSTSDQEGHWTPANRINLVKQGGFYGNMYSYHRSERPTTYDPPVVWLPKNVDRSPAESLWVTSDKWGPLSGNLISTSYGTGQVFLVPYEQLGTVYQGGAVRFPLDFPTGTMRARFHPKDGQLYICGLFGWSSNKTRPGGFYRVRYTGQPAHMPVEYHVARNGISLKFSEPLDRATAQNVGNFAIQQWNYRWTKNYGSAHYSVADPKKTGQDDVRVSSATLLPDNQTVFLEIEDLQTVMQMRISWALKDVDGNAFENDMHATINRLGDEFDIEEAMDKPREIVRKIELAPGLVQSLSGALVGASGGGRLIDASTVRTAVLGPQKVNNLLDTSHRVAGQLRVSRPGQYSFRVRGKRGELVGFEEHVPFHGFRIYGLHIGGQQVRNEQTVRLGVGHHTFELSGTILRADPRRVEWKSDTFDWEPIPPSVLRHDPRDEDLARFRGRREGRVLFAESRCIRCHSVTDDIKRSDAMPELNQTAPSLADAGERFKPQWLRDWILNPKSLRPDTNMPAVLHGVDSESDAMDIAAYLSTLGSFDDVEPAAADADAGEILWEDLGCIACHRTTPVKAEDDYDRRSLHHVDQKYQVGAMARFLKAPRKNHAWRRMPDFALTDAEAGNLVAFLRGETPDAAEFETTGDPRNGRILFGSVGCTNCHSIDGNPPRGQLRGLSLKETGCLAKDDSKRGDAPNFGFTRDQQRNLVNFIENDLATLAVHIPSEAAERAIARLNCNACHTRDHRPGLYREVFSEEGTRGVQPEMVPPLTWAGEKFKTDWMAKFISGENKSRLRPHLRIRMPRFGPYGDIVATGLAHQHGVDPNENPKTLTIGAAAEIGRKLVGRDGGFNCLQCHGIGDQKPTAAFDALGVNLEQIPARIRRPFFDRWMLDPPRIDVSTKMPKLSTNGRTSVRDVADGDAAKQFDAIWHYLNTLK